MGREPNLRLSDGNADNRRMARIIAELFDVAWVQPHDTGATTVEIAERDRDRFEEFLDAFGLKVSTQYSDRDHYGRRYHEVRVV